MNYGVVTNLRKQLRRGVVAKEHQGGGEMLIQVRASGETCQRRTLSAVGREGEDFRIARIDRLGGKDGGDDAAVHRFCEGQNAFCQIDLDASTSELHFPHAVCLLGIDSKALNTGSNLIERRFGCSKSAKKYQSG